MSRSKFPAKPLTAATLIALTATAGSTRAVLADDLGALLAIGAGAVILNQALKNGGGQSGSSSSGGTRTVARNASVIEAQQLLNQLGFSAGGADGVMGPNTRRAITDFRASYGVPGGPEVTDELLVALRSAANGDDPAIVASKGGGEVQPQTTEVNGYQSAIVPMQPAFEAEESTQVSGFAPSTTFAPVAEGAVSGGETEGGFVSAIAPMQPAFSDEPSGNDGVDELMAATDGAGQVSPVVPLQPAFQSDAAGGLVAAPEMEVETTEGTAEIEMASAIAPAQAAFATDADGNPVAATEETTEIAAAAPETAAEPEATPGPDILGIHAGTDLATANGLLLDRSDDWINQLSGAASPNLRLVSSESKGEVMLLLAGADRALSMIGRSALYPGVGIEALRGALTSKYGEPAQEVAAEDGTLMFDWPVEGTPCEIAWSEVGPEAPLAAPDEVAGFLVPVAAAPCGAGLTARLAPHGEGGSALSIWLMNGEAAGELAGLLGMIPVEEAPAEPKIEL